MERKKDELEDSFHGTLAYGPQSARQDKKTAYRKPPMHFKGVNYDADGKFLILHHYSAQSYYRMNIVVLMLFFGLTTYSYVNSPQVFFGRKWVANLYLLAL